MNWYKKINNHGFTLIELLIVVAIIAILAAIAIPNFLAAQVRAKVSRTKADERTLMTGLEAYNVDANGYPTSSWPFRGIGRPVSSIVTKNLYALTTPIAYISAIGKDPFGAGGRTEGPYSGYLIPLDEYTYVDRLGYRYTYGSAQDDKWFNRWVPAGAPIHEQQCIVQSIGPNLVLDEDLSIPSDGQGRYTLVYDPSNGTISAGDIQIFLPWYTQQ